eukprot:TRINITY_DN15458_c0_g1_i2.p1 TRINITY_DN15458_c0_g1~~TRINITY_DN15458_c0_g1_i2.p1  ORF type:complete len:195 (+),score=8.72 TRINITY_DN15458_c0_g1_i2:61-645(+)
MLCIVQNILAMAVAATMHPRAMPVDYTAELSVVRSGLTYAGSMQFDGTGRRWSEHITGLEQTTIVVQPYARTVSFTYVVIPTQPSPTCTCRTQLDTSLSDPWFMFMNGVSNGTSCKGPKTGKTGTLFVVDTSPYVNSPSGTTICQDSQGVPVYTTESQELREFVTFTPGRPDIFNTTALQAFLPSCSSGCSAPP